MTVTWGAVAASGGYEVDVSTASDFTGIVKSTITTDGILGLSLIVDSMTSLAPQHHLFHSGRQYDGRGD